METKDKMETKNKALFSDFGPTTREAWMEKVKIDLKGADFDQKLVWKNLSGIAIQPYYNAQDPQRPLKNPGNTKKSLVNYRNIVAKTEKEANSLALKALEEGITGLIFNVKRDFSASKLLKDIDLNNIAVAFKLQENGVKFAKEFYEHVKKTQVDPKKLNGFFDQELITTYLTKAELNPERLVAMAKLIDLAKDYPDFKAVSIAGTTYLDSGASQVQEIAYTLNSLVFLIEKLSEESIEPQQILDNLHIELAIGPEYFVEIAKFRAFHSLLCDVAGKYDVSNFTPVLTAKTSLWSKANIDAHTNMLRATTETMAAVLGNVNGVLIDAYDSSFSQTSDFSRRIAGNIFTLLKEESYFDKVDNPVDGSYYVENIATQLAEKALELFKEIEKKGGLYEVFEKEILQKEIAEVRFKKIKLLSQRRLSMVGVNKFPNAMEAVNTNLLSEGGEAGTKVLKPRRATLEMEALRKTTEKIVAETGKRPVVELASFGNLSMRKARATFSHDFLGIGGFEIHPERTYSNAIEAAKESAVSETEIVVMCSSDQDYEAEAINFIKTFRGLNKDKILLLAGNPIELKTELNKAGLDGYIHLKLDSIETITKIQNKIKAFNNL